MKNAMKVTGQWCVKMSFLLLLLVPASIGVAVASVMPMAPATSITGCQDPGNLTVTARGTGSISFAWDGDSEATSYQVSYLRISDNATGSMTTSSTTANLGGLTAGYYRFTFTVVYPDKTYVFIITDDLIM